MSGASPDTWLLRARMLAAVGERCVVELRRASTGAFCAAVTVPAGSLVTRSRTFDPAEAVTAERARGEVDRALRALGWRADGAEWVRVTRA